MAYLGLLRRRSFALLWVGATVSILGDGLSWVALVWLVYELGGTSADVATLVVCYTAPVVAGGLAAGVILDRFDRRRVLIADNLLRAAAMALVPLAALTGVLAPVHLYAAAAVYGLLKMVSLAGVPALIPVLVGEDDLDAANALETVSYGVGGVVGPALAGVLIALVGAPAVVALDAASYVAFAACLVFVRTPAAAPSRVPGRAGIGPAVRFVIATPAVLATTLMFMSFNVGEGILLVVLPDFVRTSLGGDALALGALLSAFTAGTLVGSLVVGAVRWRWPLGRSIAAAQLAAGLAAAGLIFAPGLAGAIAVLGAFGLLASPLTVWAQTLRMRLIPPEMRGRAFALLRTLMQSTPPVGGIAAGLLLSGGGATAAVAAIAALVAVPGLLGLLHGSLAPGQPDAPESRPETRGDRHDPEPDDRGAGRNVEGAYDARREP